LKIGIIQGSIMGIAVVSSVSSSGNFPIMSGNSSLDSALPVDFSALLSGQLLAANPNLLTENTGKKDLPLSEDLPLDPEQLAELAALDPALAAQLGNPAVSNVIQLTAQQNTGNSLDSTVDRNSSLISGAAGNPLDELSGKQNNNALGDALLRDINAATGKAGRQAASDETKGIGNFADSLAKAGNKLSEGAGLQTSTATPSGALNTSATLNSELSQRSLAESANFAADLTKIPSSALSQAGSIGASTPSAAQQSSAAATAEITTPLHDAHWSHDFSEKIVWMAKSDQQTAQININPPELGPMQIRLNLSGDQATAVFASQHAEVRQAIEEAMPRLREMLSSSGISLGEANVGAQLPQQNRENAPQFTNQNPNGNRLTGENAILAGDISAKSSTGSVPIQRGRGLVDLFA
jgi:flagellar hook-length control protein FliK